jgi:hypothetical protein
MNRRAFVSINRVRAGRTNLEASISRFNIVSKAECERDDSLQTDKHTFRDFNGTRTDGQQ